MAEFTIEFLDEYLKMQRVDKSRLSALIQSQILALLNSGSADRVVEELAFLEGNGITQTKVAREFKKRLKGFWHKHYSSSRFIGKNLMNAWEMDKESSLKFEKMALEVSAVSIKESGVDDLKQFCSNLAMKFVGGYEKKSNLMKLTGEWIVFKKHEGVNYYLTLANHSEEDERVLKRILLCEKQFSFLFKDTV